MSIQRKLTVAYFWNICGKWGVRLVGIGSTLILARLLDPSAFGVVALATICIGFFETLTDIGINRYLISQTELDSKAMNTSWTLALVMKVLLIFILVCLSEFLADFMDAPEIQLIVIVLAFSSIFSALTNIGLVRLEKALEYKRISTLLLTAKLISAAVTLSLAFYFQNYWALVAGGICSTFVYCVGSYFITTYRPKISFALEKGQLSFSGKIMARAVLGYTRSKLDVFLVGNLFDKSAVGKYNIGQEFAILPLTEVITPASTAMFPALAQFRNDKQELFDKTYKYFALVYGFVMPCIVGMWFIAPQFCTVILGPKWSDTASIMSVLAMLMLPFPLTAITNNLFDYLNKTQISLFSDCIGIVMLLTAFKLLDFSDVTYFAWVRSLVGIVAFVAILVFVRATIGLSISKMISVLGVPLVASLFMWFCLTYGYHSIEISLIGLLINVVIGGLSYGAALIAVLPIMAKIDPTWAFWHSKLKQTSSSVLAHLLYRLKSKGS